MEAGETHHHGSSGFLRTSAQDGPDAVAQLRVLLENISDVVVWYSADGIVRWVSASMERVLGWRPEHIIGQRFRFAPEEDQQANDDVLAAALREHTAQVTCRTQVLCADGSRLWAEVTSRFVFDELGALEGAVAVLRDVQTEVEAERALAASEDRYRLMAENASDVVFLTDTDRRVVWIAPAVTTTLGWDPGELAGTRMSDLLHPDDLAATDGARKAMLAGRQAAAPVGGRVLRWRTKAGDYRWFSERATPLTDASGAFTGVVVGMSEVGGLVHATQVAEASGERLRATLDSLLDPHVLLDPVRSSSGAIVDFVCIDANPAACHYLQTDRAGLLGSRLLDRFPGERVLAAFARVAETGRPLIADDIVYVRQRTGDEVHFDSRAVNVGDGVAYTWRDTTDQHEARQVLAASEARYRLLAENASDVVLQVDPDGSLSWVSDSVVNVLGWRPEQILGTEVLTLIPGTESVGAGDEDSPSALGPPGEVRVLCSDGSSRWMALSVRGISTAAGISRVVALHDIQDQVTARTALDHAIGHDPLTGLAARPLILTRLANLLDRLPRADSTVAVLCVGVDSLASVNDAYTHAAGDLVLTNVAARIATVVGDPDVVGRGAGVEFLVLVPDWVVGTDVAALAEKVRLAAKGEIVIGGQPVEPTVSVGIATGTRDSDPERLVRDASLAVRQAKANGRDRVEFIDGPLSEEARLRLSVESAIREGLRDGEFTPWFQPIVDLDDGHLVGYEALARRIRADGTVVLPGDFVPVAERSLLIADLDLTVLQQSLAVLAGLPAPVHVAVNVSATTLTRPGYPRLLAECLSASQADPSRLHLEVTETTLFSVTGNLVEAMRHIADTGARWYVDDFGTGYSSISHLRDLPVCGLKLDLSFTAGIGAGDPTSIRVSQALAGLARGLGLDTVAEGVETREQAAVLAAHGWRTGQGWLFGRPAPLHRTSERSRERFGDAS